MGTPKEAILPLEYKNGPAVVPLQTTWPESLMAEAASLITTIQVDLLTAGVQEGYKDRIRGQTFVQPRLRSD
jgi:hypothetical protein